MDNEEIYEKALLNLELILNKEFPELVDEWTKVPQIWDRIRRKCDASDTLGNYILTCSTELSEKKQKEVFHSGAGRIGKLKMYPMSLLESKVSTKEASLMDMYNDTQKTINVVVPSLQEIASLIIRGDGLVI